MSYTPVLQLTSSDWQSQNENYYIERSLEDARNLSSLQQIDDFAGDVTASFSTQVSTALSGANVSQIVTNSILGGYLGSAYAAQDRVIKEVVAWAAKSGSGGVTRIDVQIQNGSFASIFSNNAFKPAVSSSLGDYGASKSTTFVSGSNMVWRAGTMIKILADTAAGDATALNGQYGLNVAVFWKPSGSYGV
jgi:hypothetical protein